MSKELKFRAWDKKRKCYAKVIQTTNQGWKGYRDKTYITNGVMRFSKWVLSRFIIEQYTGLTDKNGKEIYEGDIVDDGFSRICEIIWSEHSASFEAADKNGFLSNLWLVSKYGEVIGNIHENPELLGGEE